LQPNGERYPLVGGTRRRYFGGTNLKPRKVLENAQTPTSRVHAVLARFWLGNEHCFFLHLRITIFVTTITAMHFEFHR
jgi:hypothetical protein